MAFVWNGVMEDIATGIAMGTFTPNGACALEGKTATSNGAGAFAGDTNSTSIGAGVFVEDDFLQLVEEVWNTQIIENLMWKLQLKLKIISRKLTHWSKEVIGKVFDQVNIWEEKMQELKELDILNNIIQPRRRAEKRACQVYQVDKNARYFVETKGQNHMNHRDNWIQGEDNIAKAAVHHFQHLFNLHHDFRDQDILNYIPSCITEEDNANLRAMPKYEEIKKAVFSMSSSSSVGPDGYNGTVYHKCWNIIKNDVQDFFNGRRLTKFYSLTCLVLIPKWNLLRKLNPFLNKIIFKNQSGFIKGRMIIENVLLAQEIVQNIKQLNTGGNIILKECHGPFL
ncbi:uncharacterized protein [Nicotiana sylvestris]|uniref:uncharacterized protein n=1 Tax=Nicotiana sylvestris TaxID=4096 RepID=UPI00388CCD84